MKYSLIVFFVAEAQDGALILLQNHVLILDV